MIRTSQGGSGSIPDYSIMINNILKDLKQIQGDEMETKTLETEVRYIDFGDDPKAFKIMANDLYYRSRTTAEYRLLTHNFDEKDRMKKVV